MINQWILSALFSNRLTDSYCNEVYTVVDGLYIESFIHVYTPYMMLRWVSKWCVKLCT